MVGGEQRVCIFDIKRVTYFVWRFISMSVILILFQYNTVVLTLFLPFFSSNESV